MPTWGWETVMNERVCVCVYAKQAECNSVILSLSHHCNQSLPPFVSSSNSNLSLTPTHTHTHTAWRDLQLSVLQRHGFTVGPEKMTISRERTAPWGSAACRILWWTEPSRYHSRVWPLPFTKTEENDFWRQCINRFGVMNITSDLHLFMR